MGATKWSREPREKEVKIWLYDAGSQGKTQRKMTSQSLESPFETNHIEFVAPGLFQHFAV